MNGWTQTKNGWCRAKTEPEPGPLGNRYVPRWERMAAPHVVQDAWNGGWLALDGSPDARPFPDRLLPGVTFPTAEAAMVAAEIELANRAP